MTVNFAFCLLSLPEYFTFTACLLFDDCYMQSPGKLPVLCIAIRRQLLTKLTCIISLS